MKYERITKRIGGVTAIKTYTGSWCTPFDSDEIRAIDRLCAIEDKIEQGTLIELPCKVGDTVYYIKRGYYAKPQFCEVSRPCKIVEVSFKLKRNRNEVMSGFITDNGTRYSFDGIGKTVFLTREEAENRLKELQNG